MKLHLTATSERGKPVTKSGNENLHIQIRNEQREMTAEIDVQQQYGNWVLSIWTEERQEQIILAPVQPKTAREYYCNNCDYVNTFGSPRCLKCKGQMKADETAREEPKCDVFCNEQNPCELHKSEEVEDITQDGWGL